MLIFGREFVMRGTAACSLPMGGVLLFCGLVGFSFPLFLSFLTCSGSFFRSFRPCGLPGLIVQHWEHRGGSGLWEHLKQGKSGQNRLKRGKNKDFFGVLWCFLGIFGHSKGAKPNIFLNLGLARWANCGLLWLRSSVLLGLVWELVGASAQSCPLSH